MPRYEKKNFKKRKIAKPKRPVEQQHAEDSEPVEQIQMKPSRDSSRSRPATEPKRSSSRPKRTPAAKKAAQKGGENLRVVMGRKAARRKKWIISLTSIALLFVLLIGVSFLTPTGLMEYLRNQIAAFGSGEFPVDLSGGETMDAYLVGGNVFVLSDTHAEVYNDVGKQIFSRQHAFVKPVMRVSAARGMVYDQNGTDLYIFNLASVLTEKEFENPILSGAIARNGTYAVATRSQDYAAQVEVFDRNDRSIFTWYSPTELISDVALSGDGKRLAVSVLSANAGTFLSKVYLFNYRSAAPSATVTYEGEAVLRLEAVSNNRFAVISENHIDSISFQSGQRVEHQTDYAVQLFRTDGKSWFAAAASRTGNKNDNQIIVFNDSGEQIANFDFLGTITDLTVRNKTVYVLSDGSVSAFHLDGSGAGSSACSFSVSRIVSPATQAVLALSDQNITRVEILNEKTEGQ